MRELDFPTWIFQIRISLRDVRPEIWRRIHLRSEVSLARFHKILQALMGWYDYHLYQYSILDKVHAPPSVDDFGPRESVRMEISTVFRNGVESFLYEYDFGDGWEIDIRLEQTLSPSKQKWDAICIDGARHGPAEDCGGPHAYQEMVSALKKRNGKRYQEIIEWIGTGFDPERFGVEEMNRVLAASSETGYNRITRQRFRDRT
jgi:hypothetical protein